jgi:hypothetical protein
MYTYLYLHLSNRQAVTMLLGKFLLCSFHVYRTFHIWNFFKIYEYVYLSNIHVSILIFNVIILIGLAFFYDVFFVFITPYIFGSSIMVQVASGPAVPLHNDENFCEKYPTNKDCAVNRWGFKYVFTYYIYEYIRHLYMYILPKILPFIVFFV